ncbi:hypothetical protein D3C80_1345250 [compost metagenome]
MDVAPVVGSDLARFKTAGLDGVNLVQGAANPRPAAQPKQADGAGNDAGNGDPVAGRISRLEDIEARHDRAVGVGGPAHISEDGAGPEGDETVPARNDALVDRLTEADPALRAARVEDEFDPGQLVGRRRRGLDHHHRIAVIGQIGRRRRGALVVPAGHNAGSRSGRRAGEILSWPGSVVEDLTPRSAQAWRSPTA